VVDNRYRTNVPNIYAIGDVNAKLMLAHVGSAQGIVAAEVIAGVETVDLDIEGMPRCYYCHPQIARWGLPRSRRRIAALNTK
jgi:dihydrolipoamide dehydrogenase